MTDWRIPEGEPVCHEADSRIYTATYHLDNQTSIEVADDTGQLCLSVLLEINHGVPALHLNVSGGDKLLHVHAAQGGLVLTPDSSGVRFQGAQSMGLPHQILLSTQSRKSYFFLRRCLDPCPSF